MRARVKIWIEGADGRVALSDWRAGLLDAIGRHGSLAAAARELGVPHRTAWQRVREMEDRLGVKLVEASSGGAAGGTSRLTADAEDLVRRFDAIRAGVDQQVADRFHRLFEESG